MSFEFYTVKICLTILSSFCLNGFAEQSSFFCLSIRTHSSLFAHDSHLHVVFHFLFAISAKERQKKYRVLTTTWARWKEINQFHFYLNVMTFCGLKKVKLYCVYVCIYVLLGRFFLNFESQKNRLKCRI